MHRQFAPPEVNIDFHQLVQNKISSVPVTFGQLFLQLCVLSVTFLVDAVQGTHL